MPIISLSHESDESLIHYKNLNILLLWQMSRFRTRARRGWDEEDESDDDDLFIIAGLLEGSRRNKCKKKFR